MKKTTGKSRFGVELPPEIHKMSSEEALPIIAERCEGRVLVSFSGGKDSVGVVLNLKKYFPEMHLYHMYIVPDLRLVEEGLTYYERLWGVRITRLPHPEFCAALRDGDWQPWHRRPLIDRWGPEVSTFDELAREVRRDLGWSKRVPQAVGIRADDSIFRAASLKRSGIYQRSRHVCYPIFDWTRHRLREELIQSQTRLPPEYAFFGRSFSGDGFDYKFIKPLIDNYPDDFERMVQWFPLLKAEYYRYQFQYTRAREAASEVTSFTL